MLNLIEHLPGELVGMNILGYLFVKDIVMLERACGSKESQHCFLEHLLHRPSVVIPSSEHRDILLLEWFAKRRCSIETLTISLPGDNPGLHVKNIKVNELDLHIQSNITMESCLSFLENDMIGKVRSVNIIGNQKREVMEQLSACTGNVKQLTISFSSNCNWITVDILSRWKISELKLASTKIAIPLILLIVQTCSELTSIELDCSTVDDAAVMAVAQHCSKLAQLYISPHSQITYNSLIALSVHGLLLKELKMTLIPIIPTSDIARRCSRALSYIRELNSCHLHQIDQDVSMIIQYMTGLTKVYLNNHCYSYLPLLTQYSSKLTKIRVYDTVNNIFDILSLCCVNPLLQELLFNYSIGITDATLVELIHACPNLRTLHLSDETAITDIGILALCEHCPQLQWLSIHICQQITEAAVLQLIQHCCKLTIMCEESLTVKSYSTGSS